MNRFKAQPRKNTSQFAASYSIIIIELPQEV